MNIKLTPEVEKLVEERVSRDKYSSVEAFVGEAIRRMVAEEVELDDTRARIQAAESEIDREEFDEYDEGNLGELVRDIHERGLRRLKAERAQRR